MNKGSFVTWMILSLLVASCSYSTTDDGYKINSDGIIVTEVPHRAKGQTDVLGLTVPAMDTVRVGFVGL
ncbi:MAG: glycosyl hydrolase, partial [Bacteroidales bacterium]|nr:glycosyl hydrolase [Bacteroidales bacterium]